MKIVIEISVIFLLFGIHNTTALVTSESLDKSEGISWLTHEYLKTTISVTIYERNVSKAVDSTTNDTDLVSSSTKQIIRTNMLQTMASPVSSFRIDQRVVTTTVDSTTNDADLVSSSTKQIIRTGLWQTMASPVSSVRIDQRVVTTTDEINSTENDTNLVSSSTKQSSTTGMWKAMTSPVSSVRTNQRVETPTDIWKIEWPELRWGIIFSGGTVVLTVSMTLLIIWTRGGSLHSCMKLGDRPKEEETIDLDQIKIVWDKSYLSTRDPVIDSAGSTIIHSSDDHEFDLDGYLQPDGIEVGNPTGNFCSATYPIRKSATNKTFRSLDSVESEYDEPHWNNNETNIYLAHTGVEEDRTEYHIARMRETTDYTERCYDANESDYDQVHSQPTGTEVDNTDCTIAGPIQKPRRSPITNKNVVGGDTNENEYNKPYWGKQKANIHSVHTGTEAEKTDCTIAGPIPKPRSIPIKKTNVDGGDTNESEYEELDWYKEDVNIHSVHTMIHRENTDYYNCRKSSEKEEEKSPYANRRRPKYS